MKQIGSSIQEDVHYVVASESKTKIDSLRLTVQNQLYARKTIGDTKIVTSPVDSQQANCKIISM